MRRAVALLTLLATVLSSQPVRADDVAKAKRLFRQAEQAFAKNDFEGALELYKQAYEAKPLVGFHFNLGQCYRSLGRYEEAIQHFEAYLRSSTNPKNRADAEKLIKLCREALSQQPASTPVEPEEPASAPVDREAVPGLDKEAKPTLPPAETKPGRRRLKPIYFWSGVGVTGALLLVGTVTGGVALAKSSEFKDPATAESELQDLKDSGEALRTTSTVMFALSAAAAAGTAALYFFTDFSYGKEKVVATPVPGGGMITMGGVF
jgi:tetratricopeptide (TPR) repeat protein